MLQDSLQQETIRGLIRVEGRSGLTTFQKSCSGRQIQACFGIFGAVTAEAVGSQQRSDLCIKIIGSGKIPVSSRSSIMRKLDAVLNRQSKRDMAGNPSRAEAGRTAGNCSDSLAESAAENKLVAFRMRAAVDAGRLLAWSVAGVVSCGRGQSAS